MASVTVFCRASSANTFSPYGVAISGSRWTYIGDTDFGLTVRAADATKLAQATPSGNSQDVEFDNPGTIPVGSTINSVTVHTSHHTINGGSFVGVRFRCGDSGFLYDSAQPYDQLNQGTYSNLASGGLTEYTRLLILDPMRLIPWTIANIFNTSFALNLAVDPGDGTKWEVDQHWLVIDYTPPVPPTSVTVLGQGGVQIAGSSAHAVFGVEAGAPAELHLNQWGLEGFSLQTDLEEHL